MGVSGLWDILRPAGESRSLTHLAVVDGFEANPLGVRGLRIGIDASIWFFHATYGREGENPELRTLFFRCSRLMSTPFLPLFIFDGPKRPNMKRGKRISGNQHWLTNGMKGIIEAFGYEWRMAPGEAEAELAYLNRIGVIDAILSDDVDNFLFGAIMVVRNPSATLSGNRHHVTKNADGRDDGNHSTIYTSRALLKHTSVQLSRGGCILIGLLSGGDYHQAGLPRCGPAIAHGLAKCGFGDQLLEAACKLDRDALPEFLVGWRRALREELRTNASGHLGTKKLALAKVVPDDFPDIDILLSYANPITSENDAGARRTHVPPKWEREPDLGKIAHLCELHFEWGLKDIIIKRFRTVLWPSAVLRILRRAALEADGRNAEATTRGMMPSTPTKKGRNIVVGTPSKMLAKYFSSMQVKESDVDEEGGEQLIVKIHSSRQHASTDGVLEYRLEIAPAQLVRLSEAGVQGIRKPADTTYDVQASDSEGDEEDGDGGDGKKKKTKSVPPEPDSHLRMWMPACMVEMVRPDLVEQFKAVAEKKRAKKAVKGTRTGGQMKKKTTTGESDKEEEFDLDADIVSDDSEDGAPALIQKTSKKTRKAKAALSVTSSRVSVKAYFSVQKAGTKVKAKVANNVPPSIPATPTKGKAKPLASTSSILSVLDSANKRTRKVATYREPSLPSTPSVPRPFPMAFAEEEEESSDDSDDSDTLPPPPRPQTIPSSPRARSPAIHTPLRRTRTCSRHSHSLSSSSDDYSGRIQKSPRKSNGHTSPRKRVPSPDGVHRATTSSTVSTPKKTRTTASLVLATPSPRQRYRQTSPSPRPLARPAVKLTAWEGTIVTADDSVIDLSSDSDSSIRSFTVPRPQPKPKASSKPRDQSVIEISSDSESGTNTVQSLRSKSDAPIAPLLLARRRRKADSSRDPSNVRTSCA